MATTALSILAKRFADLSSDPRNPHSMAASALDGYLHRVERFCFVDLEPLNRRSGRAIRVFQSFGGCTS